MHAYITIDIIQQEYAVPLFRISISTTSEILDITIGLVAKYLFKNNGRKRCKKTTAVPSFITLSLGCIKNKNIY